MNSRQRVLDAVNHKDPDRVPLMYRDVPEVRQRLKRDLTLKSDEELFQAFSIDFRWVEPHYIGSEQHLSENLKRDHWGVEWRYTHFNDDAGYWNEKIFPLEDVESIEDLEKWDIPSLSLWDFNSLKKDCESFRDYAVMTAPGVSSPGILQYPIQSLIGVERSLTDLYLKPEFYHQLIRKVVNFQKAFVEEMMKSSEGKIDFFRMGDDFGTQQTLLIGLQQWRDFFKEPIKEITDIAKRYNARYYQHSCGAIRDLIPEFIGIGVDVIDPLQVKANGMVPSELKRKFGTQVTFSGGVDEQELLPNGSVQEIKESVWRLLDEMMTDGGFILGPTHNFQDDIPTDNIVALYEAALSWRG